ncbi:MAG: hypothetical protein HYZ25_07615 [Chloroflexi bacterium]|nr:hypothetical protein [Chloroflexota bacterium]
MTAFTRQEVLNVLQEGWGPYIQSYQRLSTQAQVAFLARQGYARFADLLAHIVAWWEVGYQSIERYVSSPETQPRKYDVDAFNAEAVAKSAEMSEEQVIASFEKTRNFLIEFVKALPNSAFENEKVINQLNMEFIGHLSEHALPSAE